MADVDTSLEITNDSECLTVMQEGECIYIRISDSDDKTIRQEFLLEVGHVERVINFLRFLLEGYEVGYEPVRCPHDGAVCHHECMPGDCFRAATQNRNPKS